MAAETSTERSFSLTIATSTGNEIQLSVQSSQTVLSLKSQIETATGTLPLHQSLCFGNFELSNDSALSEYKLNPGDRVTFSVTQKHETEDKSEKKAFVLQLFFITFANFCYSVITTQFYPYLSKMVMTFGLADRNTTGFYTGLITGGMMGSRAISSPIWGHITDTWGRKPVLLVSLFCCVVSNITFGMSTSLYLAIASRVCLGFFGPIVIVTKTCVSEVCPDNYQNRGMAWYSSARHLGAIFGYFTGAALESPTWGPQIFIDYPFLLPNLFAALVSLIAFVGVAIWLEETLVIKHGETLLEKQQEDYSYKTLLQDQTFLLVIWTYGISSFLSTASFEVIPLWCWAKRHDGGLEFDPKEIGYTSALSTVFLVLIQQAIYTALVDKKGLRWMCLFNTVWIIPVTIVIPFISYLPNDYILIITMVIGSQLLWQFLDFQVLTAQFSMVNNCVTKRQRGKANGIGMTAGSIGRALAPPVISACFAYTTSQSFVWPFDYTCAFNVMAVLFFVMWVYQKKIPESIEKTKDALLTKN